MNETEYLLSNRSNKTHLEKSIEQHQAGQNKMKETVTIEKNGEITLPESICRSLGIKAGDHLKVVTASNGTITLQKEVPDIINQDK